MVSNNSIVIVIAGVEGGSGSTVQLDHDLVAVTGGAPPVP